MSHNLPHCPAHSPNSNFVGYMENMMTQCSQFETHEVVGCGAARVSLDWKQSQKGLSRTCRGRNGSVKKCLSRSRVQQQFAVFHSNRDSDGDPRSQRHAFFILMPWCRSHQFLCCLLWEALWPHRTFLRFCAFFDIAELEQRRQIRALSMNWSLQRKMRWFAVLFVRVITYGQRTQLRTSFSLEAYIRIVKAGGRDLRAATRYSFQRVPTRGAWVRKKNRGERRSR